MKNKNKSSFIMRNRFIIAVLSSVFMFFFACASLVVANAETSTPDDAHIVVMYRDGIENTILTREDTVGSLVDKLGIKLGEFDLLEPSREAVISSDNFKIQLRTAQPTTIIYDNQTKSLLSPYLEPRQAVEKTGIKLDAEDLVIEEFSGGILDSEILGRKLVVKRAVQVSVVLYGAPIARKTQSIDVAGVLREMNVKVGSSDKVSPALDADITPEMKIFITKDGNEVQSTEESIPYDVQTRQDSNANVGYSKILQPGVNGQKIVFYEINKSTGEKSRILETIVSQPVSEIILKGTKAVFSSYNEDGIPARVFCGSPKQGNWKNINVANAAMGRALALERGWKDAEFDALLELFACESSWNEKAGNPYSGAYGIPQAWPATKMASFGEDYMTNPLTQLKWGLNYIAARYGTPSEALAFHYRKNYY